MAQRRIKPRFKLDAPQPARRWTVLSRVDVTVKRKRPLFRVGSEQHSRKRTPFLRLESFATWRRLLGRPITLAQRRQRRRLAWIGSGALAMIAMLVGLLTYAAPARSQAQSPSALSGAAGESPAASATRHFHAPSPFASMRPHTSANAGTPPAIQAQAAFLYDPVNGWILYQKNPDQPLPVASLTKIMTLLLVVNSGSLDQSVTIGPDAAALVNSDNSYMDLSAGERLTLRQLLYGLMLPGGNDAALAIADAIGGDEPTFVAMMNMHAQQLSLSHTSFVSPDGVSDANISTARDMALLTAIAIQRADIAQITATRHEIIPQTPAHKTFDMWNTNDLLPGGLAPYAGVNGVRTGYTSGAGYCTAFSAVVNGHLLVGVLLGDPSDQARVSDAHALLDWGFAQE